MNNGLATTVSSFHVDYVYDDVTNVSRHGVAASRSQYCASEEFEDYVSNDEFKVVDLIFQGEVTYEEESDSHLSQSQ